ncbi:hypothetical protein OKA05_28130 [Luteolibacter arcticus]|uniref:HEAT repeat domain-containing protein n=1 Tax=Luteolibacter arcticus TaxID=1581411 RepID=A0ABT3GSJ0_9BACT|nr:hypothetical protein [Luteolibacter arcticus]MCW1926452.1 hypothetical protein [Luteolibacter arcticus]
MKRAFLAVIAVLGFAGGWFLTGSQPAPTPASSSTSNWTPTPVAGDGPRRELRKRALAECLLVAEEQEVYRKRTASIATLDLLLIERRHEQGCGGGDIEDDIARMISLDPAAAMDRALANPLSDYSLALASAWGRKQPEEALRYLRGKKMSYRVQDCLEAVAEARSQPEEEAAAEAETPSEPEPQEADDAPAEPRAPSEPVSPSPAEPAVAWDPANYDSDDYKQREAMISDLRNKPEETMTRIAESGSRALRAEALEAIVKEFPRDANAWPEASKKLETSIQLLGLTPDSPPSSLEIGPEGVAAPEVASWMDRQPLALRRAWAPGVVERWVEADPQAAIAWADALPEHANRNQTIQTGLIVWTHRDPTAAIAHVEGLPPGELREAAISNAAATWNCVDPAAARNWVEGLRESPGRKRALERLKR